MKCTVWSQNKLKQSISLHFIVLGIYDFGSLPKSRQKVDFSVTTKQQKIYFHGHTKKEECLLLKKRKLRWYFGISNNHTVGNKRTRWGTFPKIHKRKWQKVRFSRKNIGIISIALKMCYVLCSLLSFVF